MVREVHKFGRPHTCLAPTMSQDHRQLDNNLICRIILSLKQSKSFEGCSQSSFRVRLSSETCDCGFAQVTSFPLSSCTSYLCCFYRRVGPYVHLVYLQESVFKVYEVVFTPIPVDNLWPVVGAHLRPNLAMRRKAIGRRVSTRFHSDMDKVECQEKWCRDAQCHKGEAVSGKVVCDLLGLEEPVVVEGPLHVTVAEEAVKGTVWWRWWILRCGSNQCDALSLKHYSSSEVPRTPLPLGRSLSVWSHLPSITTMIYDILWKVEDILRLTRYELDIVREGRKFGIIKHILPRQMSNPTSLLVPDPVLLYRLVVGSRLNGVHVAFLKPGPE
ncbi:hypothetical protein Ahy_B02g060745 [Arachis hypogaea]|uniref:Uncharacterized protein n=1 Tax=Arachis hypogaea TaxID=3818 RepID=A0A445AJE7_ARAHY|nr:hypothetical protein Ahy_B02g060745 [Arachis hypogaea]